MSYQATSWAIKQKIVSKPTSRHVLLVMANYAQPNGQDVYPSVKTLSDETGLSERSVQRAISELKELGLIKLGNQKIVEVKGYPENKRPVVYDLNFGAVQPSNKGCHSDTSEGAGVTHSQLRGDTQSSLGCHSDTQIVNIKSKKEKTTNTRAHMDAPTHEPKHKAKPEPAATDGWLEFGHEVMAAAGVDYTRSMMKAGCVRQWLADAAKAGYTRQQAEAVILDVVRERAKYGGQGKPPAWFNRPVADTIANGSLGASQEAQECSQPEWEGEWRRDYLRHVQSRSNGAGKVMGREQFKAEWMKERGIVA